MPNFEPGISGIILNTTPQNSVSPLRDVIIYKSGYINIRNRAERLAVNIKGGCAAIN
jgi:hypothetical protein